MSERKLIAAMQMTIDGVAEWPAYPDEKDDPDPEGADFWHSMYASYWDTVDTLLLGRRSYEKWAPYWPKVRTQPHAGRFHRQFSEFADRAQKVVFSKSLRKAPWEQSRIAEGDLTREMDRLRAEPGQNMLLGGGPRLFHALLGLGQIDDLRLTIYPSTVGRGKTLFKVDELADNPEDGIPLGVPGRHDFRVKEARPLKSGGAVFLHYVSAEE